MARPKPPHGVPWRTHAFKCDAPCGATGTAGLKNLNRAPSPMMCVGGRMQELFLCGLHELQNTGHMQTYLKKRRIMPRRLNLADDLHHTRLFFNVSPAAAESIAHNVFILFFNDWRTDSRLDRLPLSQLTRICFNGTETNNAHVPICSMPTIERNEGYVVPRTNKLKDSRDPISNN